MAICFMCVFSLRLKGFFLSFYNEPHSLTSCLHKTALQINYLFDLSKLMYGTQLKMIHRSEVINCVKLLTGSDLVCGLHHDHTWTPNGKHFRSFTVIIRLLEVYRISRRHVTLFNGLPENKTVVQLNTGFSKLC